MDLMCSRLTTSKLSEVIWTDASMRRWDPHHLFVHKFPNRQWLYMRFQLDCDIDSTPKCDYRWWVSLYIGPRQDRNHNRDGLQTGKVGMTGLLLSQQILIGFILYILKPGQTVFVGGADSRRFQIYRHYLSQLGFRQTRYMNESAMMFTKPLQCKEWPAGVVNPFKAPEYWSEYLDED